MLRLQCYINTASIFIACVTLLASASATHMVQFILTNHHVSNVDYDINITQWHEKFDKKCNSTFIIPGWRNNAFDDVFEGMAEKHIDIPNQCSNTVRVNWIDSMNDNYGTAASAIRKVADEVATFIKKLQRIEMLQSVELVGFSLGAHLAGLVGRKLIEYFGQKDLISEIIGLDPAGPGFTDLFKSYQSETLQPTDAKVVVVLITNAGCSGSSQHLGSINFIANNGKDQTGCARYDCICSHRKSLEYYMESLTSNNFIGRNLQSNLTAVFGHGINNLTPPGDYYFKTNLVSPYGRA